MRIVDAKDTNSLLDPENEYAFQRIPQPLPVFTLKIERINILVLFRRILGIAKDLQGNKEPIRDLACDEIDELADFVWECLHAKR